MKRKTLFIFLLMLIAMVFVPVVAMAQNTTVQVGEGTTIGDTYALDPTNNNLDTIEVKGNVTLTGSAAAFIECDPGVTLKLGASIDVSGQDGKCAISFTGTGNTLIVESDAVIKSGSSQPGIKVEQGVTLDVTLNADLDVQGGACGAGIGSAQNNASGDITFLNTNGHHIIATGGTDACGIGGGKDGESGNVIIKNSDVFAVGNGIADDIGASGSAKVTISDSSAVFLKNGNIGTVETIFPFRSDKTVTVGKAYGITVPSSVLANGDTAHAYVETNIVIDNDFITNNGTEIDLKDYSKDVYFSVSTTTPFTFKYTGTDPLRYARIQGIVEGVNITIQDLNIDLNDKTDAACISFINKNNTLKFKGASSLKSGANRAAIEVASAMDGATDLTISSDGELSTVKATGGENGAGIGTGKDGLGDIVISGGTITAQGGTNAAGVGYGQNGGCNVTISGGLVFAEKGASGHDVGSKNDGNGDINISGDAIVFLKNNSKSGTLNASGHTFLDSGIITTGKAYEVSMPSSWVEGSTAYAYIYKKEVQLEVQSGGSVSPSGTQTVDHGNNLTITATPDAGKRVKRVNGVTSEKGQTIQDNGSGEYVLQNITQDDKLTVVFEDLTYDVTINNPTNGSVAPTGTQTVDAGGDLEITITPVAGYEVTGVTSAQSHVVEDKGNNVYLIKNISNDDTISVTIEKKTYTVTINKTGEGSISPTGNGTVEHGSDYVITLTADANYSIKSVTSTDYTIENVGNIYTVKNVTGDGTVEVVFEGVAQTVTINPGDHGTVNPSGAQSVPYGNDMKITVTPEEGYHVALISPSSHSVLVNDDGTYTIKNITSDDTVNITYAVNEYSVDIAKSGNGTVVPDTTQTIIHGGSLVVTATADSGYFIDSVTSQKGHKITKQSNGSYIVEQIKANDTITANFVHNAYTITATTSSYGKIEFTNTQSAAHGKDFTFKVIPKSGYHATKVTCTKHTVVDNKNGTYTLKNVTANDVVTAVFDMNKYKVKVSRNNENGSSNPTNYKYITYGNDMDISVTPDDGYHIMDVSSKVGHSIVNHGGGNYTVENIKKSDTIEIEFSQDHYTLNIRTSVNGMVDPVGYKSAKYGEDVTIKATPNQGSHIKSVTAEKHTVKDKGNGEYVIENITANDTVDVAFEQNTHAITFTSDENKGTINGSTTINIPHGNGINQGPTVTEKTGYSFIGWSEDGGATIVKDLSGYQAIIDVTFAAQYKQVDTTADNEDPKAKKGTLQGILKDENGTPLAGYHIWLYSAPREVVTDSRGVYTFTDVPFTKHTLIVKSPKGVEISRIAIDFKKNSKADSNFNDGKLQVDYTSNVEDVKIDLKVNKSTSQLVTDNVKVETQKSGSNFLVILIVVVVGLLIIGVLGSVIYRKFYTGYRH